MKDLPITPDFDVWPIEHDIQDAKINAGNVVVTWSNGRTCTYHRFFLAENAPDERTLHPLSRETNITPLDVPEDLQPVAVEVRPTGALSVRWSGDYGASEFHPGWLFAHGWFGAPQAEPAPVLWSASSLETAPSFNGPEALENPELFLKWLEALRDYGVACLEGLPQRDGLLVEIVEKIGTIRPTNFGHTYTLAIKDDPDSNAYTSAALPPHIDLPTRECPPGLQFLYTRENSTTGGAGIYVDAYKVAEDLRAEEPEHFEALTEIVWTFNNRAKANFYKAQGPIIDLDDQGRITGTRYNTWLRAPMVADIETQERAYMSIRAFAKRAQSPEYQLAVRYKPGDLFGFDNRRALHGRAGYDASGGARFIEGVYSDRDDLYSAIRTIKRDLRAKALG